MADEKNFPKKFFLLFETVVKIFWFQPTVVKRATNAARYVARTMMVVQAGFQGFSADSSSLVNSGSIFLRCASS